MKRLPIFVLCAALFAAGCDRKGEETAPAPANDAASATSDAELMAAAEAAAKASADPNAAAETAAAPAQPQTPADAPPAPAGAVPGLTLGTDYKLVPNGQPFEPLNGKIEVVEVFNFVCPACASFQPLVVGWKKKLGPDVRFTYVPAAFGGNWDQYVRSYYAAQSMGIAEQAHERTYNAIHLEDKLKGERGEDSDQAIAAFYSQFGVDAKMFAGNMRSFAVAAKFNKAKQYIISAGVNSTPTVIINGKYKVEGRTFEDKVRIADILIAHERAQAAGGATP